MPLRQRSIQVRFTEETGNMVPYMSPRGRENDSRRITDPFEGEERGFGDALDDSAGKPAPVTARWLGRFAVDRQAHSPREWNTLFLSSPEFMHH